VEVSPELLEIDKRLTNDLRYYADKAPMKVKHKDPTKGLVKIKLNAAQIYLHDRLEEMLARTGKVRALILKGRQQGASTYVGLRYYHKTSRNQAVNTFIITHKADATENLFAMTGRFHENTDERLRSPTRTSSQTGIEFEGLDSNYRVATAGTKTSGRSYTITLFHGSEYAFWLNPEDIKKGALQAVPDLPGTEVILESTANGMNNDFYRMCTNARKGIGEFELIFIPWFWQEEYRTDPPDDFELTDKEKEIKKTHGLNDAQIFWRRRKIENDFSNKESDFMQEYPCTPEEAFQASDDTLMDLDKIIQARSRAVVGHTDFPMVLGVDPASRKDRAVIWARQGQKFFKPIIYNMNEQPMEPMEFVDRIVEAIGSYQPQKVFLDIGEIGYAIYSRLKELGYGRIVVGVGFGEAALNRDKYANKRAEMWCTFRDFINEGRCELPDMDEVQADLMCMPGLIKYGDSKERLPSKQQIIKDFGASPDIGDAGALTFAYPVTNEMQNSNIKRINNPSSSTMRNIKRTKTKPRR